MNLYQALVGALASVLLTHLFTNLRERARLRAELLQQLAPCVDQLVAARDWFDLDNPAMAAAVASFRQVVATLRPFVSRGVAKTLEGIACALDVGDPFEYERQREEVVELVRDQLRVVPIRWLVRPRVRLPRCCAAAIAAPIP